MQDPIVIVGAARTPMGAFQGDFSALAAHELGAVAIRAAVERAGIAPDAVNEVIFGNCLMAGQGQAPARQASIRGGIPVSAGAVTLSKMCGSAMQATIYGFDSLVAGTNDVVIAGGMESMTNAPYLIPKARGGYRIGHGMMYDHMMLDGLEDAYDKGRSMGTFAEECAATYQFTRDAQDAYAIASVQRAQAATADGSFQWEIAPVTVSGKGGEVVIDKDEGPLKARLDKIAALKPAFMKDGTITAASSSSINDGAAALVLMRESTARQLGATPIARILAHARHSQSPNLFTTAPVGAIEAVQEDRLEHEGSRSVRGQRSLRCCCHGRDARPWHCPREDQHPWRRMRARPSYRRLRRAHHRHAARRVEEDRRQARRRVAVHRWR